MKKRHYADTISETLSKRLESLSQSSFEERHSLEQEVDVMRLLVDDAIILFDAACTTSNTKSIGSASVILRTRVKDLSDTVAASVKAKKEATDTVDLHSIEYIIKQIHRILFDGLEEPVAAVLWKQIEKNVKLPKEGFDVNITIN